jgi:DNA-binding PadR family transcriptional regulator
MQTFRYLVLGLLRDGESRHGYALMKEYQEHTGLRLSTGNFYRELQRLSVEGLVRTASNPEGADPRRAPYRITEAGAAAFEAWLTGPGGLVLDDYQDELAFRALFISEADAVVTSKVLDRWQQALWISGKILEREREAALAQSANGRHASRTLALLIGRRLKHLAADVEFLDEFRAFCHGDGPRPRPKQQSAVPPEPPGRRRSRGART